MSELRHSRLDDEDVENQGTFDYMRSSKEYRYILVVLSWFVDLSKIDLYLSTRSRLSHSEDVIERGDNPSGASSSKAYRIFTYLLMLFQHYGALKIMAVVMVQYRQDSILNNLQPKLRANATTFVDRCALEVDLIVTPEYEELMKEFSCIRTLQDILGNPWTSITGTTSIVLDWLVVFQLIFALLNNYYLDNQLERDNFLQFLVDPHAKWRKTRQELDHIGSRLVHRFNSTSSLKIQRRRVSCYPHYPTKTTISASNADIQLRCQDELRFDSLMRKVRLQSLDKPVNMDSRSHKRLVGKFYTAINVIALMNIFVIAFMLIGVILAECNIRAQHRIDMLQCKAWHANGTLITRDQILLSPIEDPEHAQLYAELLTTGEPSFAQLAHLGLRVELPLFMSPQRYITCVELVIMAVSLEIIIFFHMALFAYNFSDKLTWLRQIEQQFATLSGLLVAWQQRLDIGGQAKRDLESRLMEAAFICHLNHSLFIRRYLVFRKKSNTLLLHLALSTSEVMLVCYYIAGKTNTKFIYFNHAISVYIIFFINFYLLAASYLLGRLKKVNYSISRMLALMREEPVSVNMDSLSRLFIRHCLNLNDLAALFSFRSLGVVVSYDKLIVFNAYMFGLWLAVWK